MRGVTIAQGAAPLARTRHDTEQTTHSSMACVRGQQSLDATRDLALGILLLEHSIAYVSQ